MTVIEEIAAERQRQIEGEGRTPDHDDQYVFGDLALAGAAYAASAAARGQQGDVVIARVGGAVQRAGWFSLSKLLWPWSKEWWKPKNPRRDLIRAAALIVAEVERLDRETARVTPPKGQFDHLVQDRDFHGSW